MNGDDLHPQTDETPAAQASNLAVSHQANDIANGLRLRQSDEQKKAKG